VLGQPGIGDHAPCHHNTGAQHPRAQHSGAYAHPSRDDHAGGVDSGAYDARNNAAGRDDSDDFSYDVNAHAYHIGHHVRFADANSGRFR
jgi:hypothetical protein